MKTKHLQYTLLSIRDCPQRIHEAAGWFSARWHIPEQAYLDSMHDALAAPGRILCWYLVLTPEGRIIAGAGIIANDFHDRPDLMPNLCALWVEEDCRCQGIAGALLERAAADAGKMGYPKLYLVTDHLSFYERYGWRFLTHVTGDDGYQTRLYERNTSR